MQTHHTCPLVSNGTHLYLQGHIVPLGTVDVYLQVHLVEWWGLPTRALPMSAHAGEGRGSGEQGEDAREHACAGAQRARGGAGAPTVARAREKVGTLEVTPEEK